MFHRNYRQWCIRKSSTKQANKGASIEFNKASNQRICVEINEWMYAPLAFGKLINFGSKEYALWFIYIALRLVLTNHGSKQLWILTKVQRSQSLKSHWLYRLLVHFSNITTVSYWTWQKYKDVWCSRPVVKNFSWIRVQAKSVDLVFTCFRNQVSCSRMVQKIQQIGFDMPTLRCISYSESVFR